MISICANTIKELQRIRQHIHQYPELGFDVYNTADFIANELEKIGLEIKRGIGKTGLIADLKVTAAKKLLLYEQIWMRYQFTSKIIVNINLKSLAKHICVVMMLTVLWL